MTYLALIPLIIFVIFLGVRSDDLTFASYTRYKKRRNFFLQKVKNGSVLRGTCSSTGETFIISRSGITKEKKPLL